MSDVSGDWPAQVDDDGTGRTGTRVNVSFMDTIKTAINNQVLSATNPTLTPANTIDEVVTARGSLGSLDSRLDVEHNEDGTHKLTGTLGPVITEIQLMGGLGAVNLVQNDDFLLWAGGDAAAPGLWTLTGAAATVARTGTGLGDTSRKVGDFAAKVTRAGTNCYLGQSLLSGSAFTRADFLKQKYLAFGAWVKCSTPNIARLAVYDGIGTSYSSYHTGGGTWEFLAVTRQINSSATEITVRGVVDTSDGNAIFSGATALVLTNDFDLTHYQPSPCVFGAVHFSIAGNLSAADNQGRYESARPGIVKDCHLHVKTAPVTTAITVDLRTYDGAALATMYSALPTIAAAAFRGAAQPDSTYARRCLASQSGASLVAGGQLVMDIKTVGTGTVGADLGCEIRVLQYASPLERFQTY